MQSDVIILGGGLVGLTLALALDGHGLSSIVVDPAEPATVLARGFDGRASAVASASWRMLQAIGVGARLDGKGCPIRAIRVSDGLAPGALDFTPGEEEGPLGIMFENRLLRQTLHEAATAAPNVTLLMPARATDTVRDAAGVRITLNDGRIIRAPLLIGAEGRNSPTRAAAGIAGSSVNGAIRTRKRRKTGRPERPAAQASHSAPFCAARAASVSPIPAASSRAGMITVTRQEG